MLGKCVTPELISRLGMAWGRGFFHVPRRSNWYQFVCHPWSQISVSQLPLGLGVVTSLLVAASGAAML